MTNKAPALLFTGPKEGVKMIDARTASPGGKGLVTLAVIAFVALAVTVVVFPRALTPDDIAKLQRDHPDARILVFPEAQAVPAPPPPDWPKWDKDPGKCLKSNLGLGARQFPNAVSEGFTSFELSSSGRTRIFLRILGQGADRIVRLAYQGSGGFYLRELPWAVFENEYRGRAWRQPTAWRRLIEIARKGELRQDFDGARVRQTFGLSCE